MPSTRRLALATALVSVAAVAGIAPAVAGAADTGGLTFGVPRIVDPLHSYGEPDLKVSPVAGPNGTAAMFASGPAGTGTQRSVWDVSVDNGDSYRLVSDVPQGAQSASVPTKETNGPGGGDTEIAFDHTGKAYYADLYALKCYTVATSTDNGATVNSSPNGCSENSATADRQWYGIYDPAPGTTTTSPYTGPKPLLYMKYSGDSGAQLDMSTDGLKFTSAGTHSSNDDSPLVVDQQTGDVIEAISGSGNSVGLTVGVPNASGALTFTNHLSSYRAPGGIDTLFPVVSQDADRNVYIAYVPDCGEGSQGFLSNPACLHVYYMWADASTGWTTFHGPFRVDAPDPVTNDDTAVMPWIAAGNHVVDVVWYGSAKRMDPSFTESGQGRPWFTQMAQVTGADTDNPTVTTGQASPHPMHYNSICLNGTGCIQSKGDRNLADFFQVTIDHAGRARIVYDDTSNGLEQQAFSPTDGLADHKGAELVTVATQNTGVNAWTGAPLAAIESTAPVSSTTDPTGDSLVNKPLGGTYAKGADITSVGVAPNGDNVNITVTTAGDTLGSAAVAAGAPFGQIVVRWQLGDTIYYAEAEQPATGTPTEFYAGAAQSIDLCSVSACDPHYFVYPGAANGGNLVTGTVTTNASGTSYTITVPKSDIGNPTASSLLEEVAGYVFTSTNSANVTPTNPQAQAEQGIPVEIEGTRTFNSSLGAPGPSVPEAPLAVALPLLALLAVGVSVGLRRRTAGSAA